MGVSPSDQTKWIFKLRPGVKFHDGSELDADAVVWNVEKVLKQDAPHFDVSQVGVTATRMPNLRSAKAIDKMTVELTTAAPDALLPINLTNLYHGVARRIGRSSTTRRARPIRRKRPSRPGMRSRAMRRARARGRWTSSSRASGSSW